MDETDPTAEAAVDGIYSTCEICFGIVAHRAGHEAWHRSRGEVVDGAHDERT